MIRAEYKLDSYPLQEFLYLSRINTQQFRPFPSERESRISEKRRWRKNKKHTWGTWL